MSPFERITAAVVVGDPAPELAYEPKSSQEERLVEAERWAAALIGSLPNPAPARLGVAQAQAPAPSESWRRGVGPLTHPEAPAQAPEGEPSEPKGMLLRVNAGDLGQLSFWLERGPQGIRVLIGAGGHDARLALGSERSALEASLRAAGLPVQSVAVVPLPKLGTVLAQQERTPSGRTARSANAGSSETRAGRRLKLFG